MGVLDRSVAILEAIDGGARSLGEVIERTGLTRTTAFRLLKALEIHGFVRLERGRGYRLGLELYRLGSRAAAELPLPDLARPALERLTASTGESSQLYVRFDDSRLCVAAVESPNELRTIVEVGARLPLTRGSAGKVFLAWTTPADLESLLAGERERDRVERQLALVRRRGWAQSAGERQAGVGSVSAPILGRSGELLAAVSVSGPIGRMRGAHADRYAPAVLAAAREIEAAVG